MKHKNITTLVTRNRHFTIILKDGNYLAIEDKYITDGILNTTLNGFQMHASKSLEVCLDATRMAVERDYLMESGMSRAEAICKVCGIPYTKEAEELLG